MIVAIIVTYNPSQKQLQALIERSLAQVDAIVVVDNGSSVPVQTYLNSVGSSKLIWCPLGENKGIAAAHNQGIAQARSMNAEYVLLFDHDSLPSSDMVHKLTTALQTKEAEGYKVAAVGPSYKDVKHNNKSPFIRINGLWLKRAHFSPHTSIVPVDYLISSGSLIPLRTLENVGIMDEALFIDYVDIEWGLRARTKGYQSFGTFDAVMEHDLGDVTFRALGDDIAIHSPLRHYYIFRNAIWLYRKRTIPINWKFVDGARLVARFFAYSIYGTPHLQHIQSMLKGIQDGLRGKMGKASQ